jgi:alpha-glucosidase
MEIFRIMCVPGFYSEEYRYARVMPAASPPLQGTAEDVIVGPPQAVVVVLSDGGSYFELSQVPAPSPNVVVRLSKAPLMLSVLVDGLVVVQEVAPLTWNATTSWQTLAVDAAPFPEGLTSEWFFGGGMQNGRFSHRNESITIAVDYNWDDGGHPNAVPWYVSSAGYGVFRNTWAPGVYSFGNPAVTAHNESDRFDVRTVHN